MILPVSPRLDHYRGSKPNLQRKAADFNRTANRVAAHLNKLIADNPDELQQYTFANVASQMGLDVEQVRRALPGGYNGITLRVDENDRRALSSYKTRTKSEGA